MTDEDIDKITAGSKLDALVAEMVMGMRFDVPKPPYSPAFRDKAWLVEDGAPYNIAELHFSTSIAQAWRLLEKLKPHTWSVGWFEYFDCQILREAVPPVPDGEDADEYAARMFQDARFRWHHASGTTAPLAICRATLKAVR